MGTGSNQWRGIRLTLPAELRYRDIAVRAVAAACQLVSPRRTAHGSTVGRDRPDGSEGLRLADLDLSDNFAADMVSAVSELFNNVAIHSYAHSTGDIALEMEVTGDHLEISISDTGTAFDLSQVPTPELASLPEGGMGIHIARACVDELHYTPGPPNVWRLTKYKVPTPKRIRPRRLTSQL